MDQVAENLNRSDHPRHPIGPLAHRLVNRADGPPRGLAETTQKRAVVTEVDPQPLGNREHELPVGYLKMSSFKT